MKKQLEAASKHMYTSKYVNEKLKNIYSHVLSEEYISA